MLETGCVAWWGDWAVVEDVDCGLAFLRFLGDETLERWPLENILDNLALRLNELYRRVQTISSSDAAGADEARACVDSLRRLAARWPYGDSMPPHLRHLADEVDRIISWPVKHFLQPPVDGAGLVNLDLNATIWAAEQVRLAVGQGYKVSRKEWFDKAFVLVDQHFDRSAEAVEQRIRRLGDKIRHGHEQQLVADVLDTLRAGPRHSKH